YGEVRRFTLPGRPEIPDLGQKLLQSNLARDIAVVAPGGCATSNGAYILIGTGLVQTLGPITNYGGTMFGSYWWPLDLGVDLEVTKTQCGYYMLDAMGRVYVFGDALWHGHVEFDYDLARDLELDPLGNGYVILDGFGALHPYGEAPFVDRINEIVAGVAAAGKLDLYFFGWDIARAFELESNASGQVTGFLVLDGYGVVRRHELVAPMLSNSSIITSVTYPIDIARDLETGNQTGTLPSE
ncbi:MAG TPA: hypothetical protein PKH07_19420, partial [bacterium]|nr:hypothetical protein [bacterium]